ncbi:MAG TPA: hypothetical protein VL500_03225 [Candidatus Eisenbacteria bacterium]|nr:hypothetical protein [Candidatus Eisenbacteria bacterium]
MSALKLALKLSVIGAALVLVGAGCSSSTTIDTNGSIPPIEAGATVK